MFFCKKESTSILMHGLPISMQLTWHPIHLWNNFHVHPLLGYDDHPSVLHDSHEERDPIDERWLELNG